MFDTDTLYGVLCTESCSLQNLLFDVAVQSQAAVATLKGGVETPT